MTTLPGPSVSGQPTPTTDDLLDKLDDKTPWPKPWTDDPVEAAARVIGQLRQKLDEARSQLAEARRAAEIRKREYDHLHGLWEQAAAIVADEGDVFETDQEVLDAIQAKDDIAANDGYAVEVASSWRRTRKAVNDLRAERDSLREERDGLVAEVRRVADEWDAQTDHVDWDAVNVVERFVADLRAVLAATAPQPAPAEPPAAPVQTEERADADPIDLEAIRRRHAQYVATSEPAKEYALAGVLCASVPYLLAEIDSARVALATAERQAEHSAKEERDEAKAWAVKLRGLLWDALMAPAPLTSAVDVTGTLVERAKALRADFDALRTEVQRIADDCGVRAVQRAGTTNPSSRAAFVIYDKIATELRAALGATPDTGSTT